MKNTLTKFERFLFKPTTPIGLGLFRIFYYLSVMLFAHNAFAEMQFNRSSVLYETIGIFKFLPELQTTDYLTTLLLYKIFQFLSFCALIGLGAMPIRICVFIVGAYTFGNQYNFQIYHQHDSFVIISLFILISAELNECWSVDSLYLGAHVLVGFAIMMVPTFKL